MNIRIPEQNYVLLTGRLTRDPDLRYTGKGMPVCSFDIAVNKNYKDKATGEWKEKATFVGIVAWGPMGERSGEKLKKGSPVHVEGSLESSEYIDREGNKRKVLKINAKRIQFLAVASKDDSPAGNGSEVGAAASEKTSDDSGIDEVPF
ncbi:MAG: single-stranded DNA-binding protein [Elusimicrobiales bacterium]|nr:single-stranded DNA-binding protein [Elusimicrobiales bacterium]